MLLQQQVIKQQVFSNFLLLLFYVREIIISQVFNSMVIRNVIMITTSHALDFMK